MTVAFAVVDLDVHRRHAFPHALLADAEGDTEPRPAVQFHRAIFERVGVGLSSDASSALTIV